MFKKLLYINLLSITVLSLFNYFVFHNMNSESYLENFKAYNQRIANMAFQNIDLQIVEAAMKIPQLYFSSINQNKDILLPQDEDIIGSPAPVRKLVDQLERLHNVYPYAESVDIFYEATNTVVTDFSSVHQAETEEKVLKYLPWYDEFRASGRDVLFLDNSGGVYPTRKPSVSYIKKVTLPRWKGRAIFVAVHISLDSFQNLIDEENGTLVLVSPDDKILYLSEGGRRQTCETVLAGLEEKGGETRGFPLVSVNVSDEDVTVFSYSSLATGVKYAYYIQDSTFYADYNMRNRIFLMNFFISIIFNLLILMVLSWINHYTFKKQVLKASKEAGIEIGGRKASIDHSLNVLTNEILTLNETVQSSKPLLRQNAVRALLLSREQGMVREELGTYLSLDSVRVVLMYCPESTDLNETIEALQESYLNRNNMYHALFTTMERDGIVSILVFDRENEEKVFEDFAENFGSCLKVSRMVWGGALPLEKDNIKNSFKSAVETARYGFIYPEKTDLRCEEMNLKERKGSGSHLKLFDLAERAVNGENYLDFKYHIESLMVSFKDGNYTIDYCHSTLRDLVALLYQIMNQKQLDMWIVFGYDIREYYKQIEDIDQFGEWILNLCEVLLRNIRQKKQTVDTDLQTRLARMIEENLENDISLDFLSDQFSMRPDALSRLFKQMMGKGYTEYIKEKKMERALELLKEDHSVKDIAQKLGYNSPQYFIKIFKEIYGVTPHQYKKKHFVRGRG